LSVGRKPDGLERKGYTARGGSRGNAIVEKRKLSRGESYFTLSESTRGGVKIMFKKVG